MKSIFALILSLVVSISFSVQAQDHLEPENYPYADQFMSRYKNMILETFGEAFDEKVRLRAIVQPSFHPEFVVYLREYRKEYTIVAAQPEHMLWGYEILADKKSGRSLTIKDGKQVKDEQGIAELESRYPKNFRDLPILRCEVDIDKELAKSITVVWESMLRETRYKKDQDWPGLDGTTYHFSMEAQVPKNSWLKNMRGKLLAGRIWHPPAESKTGKLVKIAKNMYGYCYDNTKENLDILSNSVTSFEAELK